MDHLGEDDELVDFAGSDNLEWVDFGNDDGGGSLEKDMPLRRHGLTCRVLVNRKGDVFIHEEQGLAESDHVLYEAVRTRANILDCRPYTTTLSSGELKEATKRMRLAWLEREDPSKLKDLWKRTGNGDAYHRDRTKFCAPQHLRTFALSVFF